MTIATENYNVQKRLAVITFALFAIKLLAWYLTGSVAILTDMLEYTINVISSLIGLYSLQISAIPRDLNHPYGHGKAEFISAAIEGLLMVLSAFVIVYQAIQSLRQHHVITELDRGIYLVALTAVINYAAGFYAVRKGKRSGSPALEATGRHMKSDTHATIGVVMGLALIFITHLSWIDSAVALLFAIIIVVSGYRILRSSIAGIMDEADMELLKKLVAKLQSHRRPNWIDLHNLRIVKYGVTLHLDCHMTVPWYMNIRAAHQEIDALTQLAKENFDDTIELQVHTDDCQEFSCRICSKTDCPVRQHNFEKRIDWTVQNISRNRKHRIELAD